MIASVTFRNFKALRNTSLSLAPFNLVVGPNGSGKTSFIQALLRLRTLAKLHTKSAPAGTAAPFGRPTIAVRFAPPYGEVEVELGCSSEFVCDLLHVRSPEPALWEHARAAIGGIRSFLFDHYAMAEPALKSDCTELAGNGGNFASVLASWHRSNRPLFERVEVEFCRLLPEFRGLDFRDVGGDRVQLIAEFSNDDGCAPAENLSQGTLYTLATLTLAFAPQPPSVICIEEIDRGIHPRLLRDIRDAFYRLSYPEAFGEKRAAVQVIATTHSPYLLDLFREHPEEIVIAQKEGSAARFERLADRPDLEELLQGGPLGDIWFSGILGGVPEEKGPGDLS